MTWTIDDKREYDLTPLGMAADAGTGRRSGVVRDRRQNTGNRSTGITSQGVRGRGVDTRHRRRRNINNLITRIRTALTRRATRRHEGYGRRVHAA